MRTWFALSGAGLCALLVLTVIFVCGNGATEKNTTTKVSPKLGMPAAINFGDGEQGTVLRGSVSIENLGTGPLVLDEFTSNCACIGFEPEDGTSGRIEELSVPAGQKRSVRVRLAVKGEPGNPFSTLMRFRTNDPKQPTAQLELRVARVTTGLIAEPARLHFGQVLVGDQAKLKLVIRDHAKPPRKLLRLETSDTQGLDLCQLPLPFASASADPSIIAEAEITVQSTTAGELEGQVIAFIAGEERAPLRVPVSAVFLPEVTVSPKKLLLPRESAAGPIYSATCRCACLSHRPFELDVGVLPRGITCEVLAIKDEPDVKHLVIRLAASQITGQQLVLRLTARIEDRLIPLEVQVLTRPSDGARP